MFFLILPRHQQLCHPCAGLCGGLGSMAAAIYFRPFSLMRRDRRIKADIKGLPHQATVVGEPVEPPLPHVGRAHAPNPVGLWRSRTRHLLLSLPFFTAHSHPLPSWRTRIRHLLSSRGSLSLSLCVIATRNDEAIHF